MDMSAGSEKGRRVDPVKLLRCARLLSAREQAAQARIGTKMAGALKGYADKIQEAVDPDNLPQLIQLCSERGFSRLLTDRARTILLAEQEKRSQLITALGALAEKKPLPVDAFVPILVAPLSALRNSLQTAMEPVRELQAFIRSPDDSRLGRRMAARSIGLMGHPLLAIGVSLVASAYAQLMRKRKIRAFAQQIADNAVLVPPLWKAMAAEHEEQARMVASVLYFTSLEPHVLAALNRGDDPTDVLENA